jgi:hypothetical protein
MSYVLPTSKLVYESCTESVTRFWYAWINYCMIFFCTNSYFLLSIYTDFKYFRRFIYLIGWFRFGNLDFDSYLRTWISYSQLCEGDLWRQPFVQWIRELRLMFYVYTFTSVTKAMDVCSFCEPFSNTLLTAGLVCCLLSRQRPYDNGGLGELRLL